MKIYCEFIWKYKFHSTQDISWPWLLAKFVSEVSGLDLIPGDGFRIYQILAEDHGRQPVGESVPLK